MSHFSNKLLFPKYGLNLSTQSIKIMKLRQVFIHNVCIYCMSVFSAPFTIQRLAELIVNPRKHYKKANKWLRGLEKVNLWAILHTIVSKL